MNYKNLKLFKGKKQEIKEQINKFVDGKYDNLIIFLDKKKVNIDLNMIRSKCPGTFIDRGTYAMCQNKGADEYIINTDLTERKFWRIVNNFTDAITNITKYDNYKIVDTLTVVP